MNKKFKKYLFFVGIIMVFAWALSANNKIDRNVLQNESVAKEKRAEKFVEILSDGLSKATGSEVPTKILKPQNQSAGDNSKTP